VIDRPFAALAAIFAAIGVVAGAFGAHALRAQVDPASLQAWHTAVEYQLLHALALLVIATRANALRFASLTSWLFATGIALFSGSLYAIVLGAPHLLGAMTPVGGLAFIAGWCTLAWGFLRRAPP